MRLRRKTKSVMPHEYISSKQYYHGYIFRLSNYFVLLSIVFVQRIFGFVFPDSVYLLICSGIVGYDIPTIIKLVTNLAGRKK